MAHADRIQHNPAIVPPLQPAAPATTGQPGRTADGKTFEEVLRSKVATHVRTTDAAATTAAPADHVSDLKWSAHATARLRQRGIELDPGQLQRVDRAVEKAAAKGCRDSLVMVDDATLVVSVKNSTVITALHRDQARENVFTNIDSAVIA